MHLLYTRYGHPFIDPKVPFNDLEEFAIGFAKGDYLDRISGRYLGTQEKYVERNFLKVLSFDFEKGYALDGTSDNELIDELYNFVRAIDCSIYKYDNDYKQNVNETLRDMDYLNKGISFMRDSLFAVVFLRYMVRDGKKYQICTAIHRKYQKAIVITKDLYDQKQGFLIEDKDYTDIDIVLKPLLKEFRITY